MQSVERINRFWTRRLLAGGALTLLMSGLLTAVGLGMVVVAVAAAVLVVVAAGAAARAVHAYGPGVRRRCLGVAASVRRRSAIAFALARRRLAAGARAGAEQASRGRRHLATSAAATTTRARERAATWMVEHAQSRSQSAEPPPAIDLHREALRLNGAGTRQRRNGALADAIALHGRALQILEVLDDRRTVALTQNNLALALSQVGDDERAVALFEQAAATLHELGEDEHEGQIIANLGLAHRRYGRHEECADVLQLALEKLPPASQAYATVEAELKRAS